MKWKITHALPAGRIRALPPFFSLSSQKEEQGWGEEPDCFQDQIPSPRPSPRSGGARESGAVSSCAPARRSALQWGCADLDQISRLDVLLKALSPLCSAGAVQNLAAAVGKSIRDIRRRRD